MNDYDGTTFTREFVYALSNWFWAILDRLFIRRHIQAESAEALRRLKSALESSASK